MASHKAAASRAGKTDYERIDYANGRFTTSSSLGSTTSSSVANPFDTADDGEVLHQSLLLSSETSSTGTTPAATGQALLSVVAPATLPEGYTIDVQVGGRGQLFTVKVPPGGVEEGQTFEVKLEGRATRSNNYNSAVVTEEDWNGAVALPRVSIPVGSWRDGLCDCCRFGCCHPVFWNAFCCSAVLTAQVMTRMNLDILGRPAPTSRKVNTFYVVLIIVLLEVFLFRIVKEILFWMTHNTLTLPSGVVTAVPKEGMEGVASLIDTFFLYQRLMYIIFVVYILTVTRSFLRNKYAVPTHFCHTPSTSAGVVEDCCLSFWCSCCTAGQLARHTMDYDTYRGVCCSTTGVPDYVPSVI